MPKVNIKGYAFEYFVRRLLSACDFIPVHSDGLLIFDGTAGQMIQGLGQCHNADVLVDPPFQTPFYFPTRLLVECKCYTNALGLRFARNVLGLREDINNFDVVTEDILKNRRSNRSNKPKNYPMKRHLYQVALASLTGFKKTTISYAETHKIPLISFAQSEIFKKIRDLLNDINSMTLNSYDFKNYRKELNKSRTYPRFEHNVFNEFIRETERISQLVTIGLLETGVIIFLVRDSHFISPSVEYYNDGFSLHWADNKKTWSLENGNERYYFELPNELMVEWKKNADWKDNQDTQRQALNLKENFFQKIILFGTNNNGPKIIKLSKDFLDNAYNRLNHN